MKATIQKYRGDLDTAETVCADLEIGRDEFTPTASPKRSTSCKRPKDPDRALFESLQKRVAESGSILKDLSKAQLQPITSRTSFASYVKDSLLTMSKANFKKARSSINRLLTDLMDEDSDDDDDMPGATGISSIPANHPPSKISSNAFQFSITLQAHSASLNHQPPSSISQLPICGETCLQHHQCGVLSLWSLWSSTTSNPSSIHISRCPLLISR